jgi:glycosyltransferase involved in cell wall biosynthesis
MSLRVALVALYPAPGARAPGGVRAVVQNLVRGLRAFEDLELQVVHCHSDITTSHTVRDDGVAVHYIAVAGRRVIPNTLKAIGKVSGLLRELRPDIVNAHAAHYAIAALRAGCPTLLTIHGVVRREAEVYNSTLFDRLRFLLENGYERYALRRVRDIIAISPYVLKEYRDRSRARLHRIDNPLPAEFIELPNLEEAGRLLYPGTIDERKNVLDLVHAMTIVREAVPHAQLRIAGRTTNQAYYRQVQALIATERLQNTVALIGLQGADAMTQEYARSAAVVLASRQETAPMAVIEAMAAAKPVVATRVGGVPDLVEDGRSGYLVEAGDVTGLAVKIIELLQNDDLRLQMGQRARELAQRFRVENVASQYRALYYQVAGRALP